MSGRGRDAYEGNRRGGADGSSSLPLSSSASSSPLAPPPLSRYDDIDADTFLFTERAGEGVNSGFTFLLVFILLLGFGLIMLYNMSYDMAIKSGLPHYFYLLRQSLWVVASLAVSLALIPLPIGWTRHFGFPLLALGLVGSVLCLLGRGVVLPSGRAALMIGSVAFEPASFLLAGEAFYLPYRLSQVHRSFSKYFVPFAVIFTIAALLLALKDAGSATTALVAGIIMLVALGLSAQNVAVILALIALPVIAIALFNRSLFAGLAGLFQSTDAVTGGEGIRALQRGGLLGVGLGKGTAKLGALPQCAGSAIFPAMCEEIGYVWSVAQIGLFVLYGILGYRGARRTGRTHWSESRLIWAVTSVVMAETFLNIAWNIGLIPVPGVPLPFFSDDGNEVFFSVFSAILTLRLLFHDRKERRSAFAKGGRG